MKLANKDHDIDGVDDFFFKKFDVGKKYSEFSKIIIVADGQTDIRKWISQNEAVLQQNIKEDSISSKRIIKGYMLANKLQPHSIEIKNEITKPVRAARTRYAVSLEEEMKKNESLKREGAKENCLHRN